MFFLFVILPVIVVIVGFIVWLVVETKANERQAEQDSKEHPVNIHDIPLFVSLLVLAEKGQLHTYMLTPYVLYFNFDLTRYDHSDGRYSYSACSVGGTLIDYAKSGYQIMIPPIYRQCVRQLEDALRKLSNVAEVNCHYGTEVFQADTRFIDENGRYANGQTITFNAYSVKYKVGDTSAGKAWT